MYNNGGLEIDFPCRSGEVVHVNYRDLVVGDVCLVKYGESWVLLKMYEVLFQRIQRLPDQWRKTFIEKTQL